ncbi:MAG: hypothetical protein EOQ89_33660 [Mesorhizobium sp.]|nr:MAG: hypothetical protein EOQ89_33660 [Mesorhizobium sp.]
MAESLMPGMRVAGIARKYEVTRGQFYECRKQLRSGRLALPESKWLRTGTEGGQITPYALLRGWRYGVRSVLPSQSDGNQAGAASCCSPCTIGSCRRPFEMRRLGRRAPAGPLHPWCPRLSLVASPSGHH